MIVNAISEAAIAAILPSATGAYRGHAPVNEGHVPIDAEVIAQPGASVNVIQQQRHKFCKR